ncbi:hypothetical protein EY688_02750 [Enterococcus casseliflavus]|nr:hypothetical protein [Enterococcus casseliflavus]MBO6367334.1 hypothetical protein [Enterococcus casseliflavus]
MWCNRADFRWDLDPFLLFLIKNKKQVLLRMMHSSTCFCIPQTNSSNWLHESNKGSIISS